MFENRLYYAAVYDDVVCSCNLNGDVLWEFTCKELSKPHDITHDAFGNIFVTCEKSNKIILIGSRGKHYRVLLGDQDGMIEPRAIHYNRKTSVLLVCNTMGTCFLNKVTYYLHYAIGNITLIGNM